VRAASIPGSIPPAGQLRASDARDPGERSVFYGERSMTRRHRAIAAGLNARKGGHLAAYTVTYVRRGSRLE
jgi:hypothetical protein